MSKTALAFLAVVGVCLAAVAHGKPIYSSTAELLDDNNPPDPNTMKVINDLMAELLAEQYQKDVPYKIGRWSEEKGLFPSFVHLNSFGGPSQKLFRDSFHIPDNNMFVTQFVTSALLESVSLGAVEANDAVVNAVDIAVEAFERHRDGNREEGVPVYAFWKQKLVNGTYVSAPENLVQLMSVGGPFRDALMKYAYKMGWNKFAGLLQMMDAYTQVFRIPADSDDTGVNLATGGALIMGAGGSDSTPFASAADQWWKVNNQLGGAFKYYVRYAYRPFGSKYSPDDSLIDPRTYFWLREYLHEKEAEAKAAGTTPDIALVSTWMSNLNETKYYFKHAHGNTMPGNANNFDASVAANAIFGMSNAVIADIAKGGLADFFDAEAQKLYTDTADLITWVIERRMIEYRQDLVLLYYPPAYDFFWFVARHANMLREYSLKSEAAGVGYTLPFPVMERVRDQLSTVMELHGWEQILARMQRPEKHTCYWDEFLGDADTNAFGAPKPTYDDRIFSTAVALTGFMDTWTNKVPVSTGPDGSVKHKLVWSEKTPFGLKTHTACGIRFLKNAIVDKKLKLENSFFSGSLKGDESNFMNFPLNRLELFNGTKMVCLKNFTVSSMDEFFEIAMGVDGVMSEEEYGQLLSFNCLGKPTPMRFTGYNTKQEDLSLPGWPYWSSPSLTRAFVIQTLSKFASLYGEVPTTSGDRSSSDSTV
eukprot:GFYU01001691.1.p1 GENE.GFYU01001691.1~~GFYU01001691.1.p1  ORF type:complete len:704 (+),score=245.11 GFYU01001691.1:142-2253(+)